jgi:hypothetical protein
MDPRSPEEVTAVRRKVAEVEFRAKADASFLAQLREDPIRVLQTEGFDDPMAHELSSQLRGEVPQAADEASSMCADCDPFTCIVTSCCWFTTEPPVEPVA